MDSIQDINSGGGGMTEKLVRQETNIHLDYPSRQHDRYV